MASIYANTASVHVPDPPSVSTFMKDLEVELKDKFDGLEFVVYMKPPTDEGITITIRDYAYRGESFRLVTDINMQLNQMTTEVTKLLVREMVPALRPLILGKELGETINVLEQIHKA